LQKELPFLLNIKKGKNEHETTLFKGLKGIQTAIFEALENMQKGEEVLAMGVRSTKDEKYNILWEKWHNERLRKKINCRILFSDKGSEYYKLFSKMSYTGVRIVEGLTPSAIDIIGKRVLIFTYGEEPSCLSIYDGEIAQSFRTLFESLWRFAKNNV
jgi:hypothetical protein